MALIIAKEIPSF